MSEKSVFNRQPVSCIYTVTTVTDPIKRIGSYGKEYEHRDFRCLGYYFDINKAKEVIDGNLCDIHEGLYTYALIEEVTEGIYPINREECSLWYKWDNESKKYLISTKPDDLKNTLNLSMG